MRDSPFLCLLYVTAIALALTAPARAVHRGNSTPVSTFTYMVYAGCSQPPNTNAGTTYYVKPAGSGGSDAANGLTLGTAWATIGHAEATMSAGDTVLVETGSYVFTTVNRSMASFTTIKADAGQTPVIAGIDFSSAGKWILDGVTVEASGFGTQELVRVYGTSSDIVFHNISVLSASRATVSGWTQVQWNESTGLVSDGYGLNGTGSCVAIDGGTQQNLYRPFSINGIDKVLVDGVTTFWFSGDAFDHSTTHLQLSNFTFRDSITPTNLNHCDYIQGQGDNVSTYGPVAIFNGTMTEETTDTPPFPTFGDPVGACDGIADFNSAWDSESIYNNVLMMSGPYVIDVASCTNCSIENNSAMSVNPGPGIHAGIQASNKTMSGVATTNLLVRNNITVAIEVDCSGDSSCMSTWTYDHNLATSRIEWWYGGSSSTNTSPGGYGSGGTNIITATAATGIFQTFTPPTALDMHLHSGSPALGAGTTPAPVCPNGTTRGNSPNPNPPDAGAYCYIFLLVGARRRRKAGQRPGNDNSLALAA